MPLKAIEKDRFYCRPALNYDDDKPWYCDSPIGHTLLSRKLKEMFTSAGLNSESVLNHSLQATGVSRMYNENIPEKIIMERSSHLSVSGVRSYGRTTIAQKQAVSNVLSKSVLTERQPESTKTDSTEEESEVSKMLRRINFQKMESCTINLNF